MTKTLTVNYCLILHEVVRLAQRRNMQLNSSLLKDLGKKLNVKKEKKNELDLILLMQQSNADVCPY